MAGSTCGAASVTAAARADSSGGSGIAWAIVAMRVGSCSPISRSKNSDISFSNSATARLTRSTRASMTAAKASISPSRACLRAAIRESVSSRMRAISAFDHSRTAATSSSAWRRRPAASSADLERMSSTATFASAPKRTIVSSREASAAVCIARLRSAMNFVGRRAPVLAAVSVVSVVTNSSAGVVPSTPWPSPAGTASVSDEVDASAPSSALVASVAPSVGWSASGRSAVQGSLKPGRVSVWDMGRRSSLQGNVGRVSPTSTAERIVATRVGEVQLASGTPEPPQWYR